jgi:uroporphyrinogen-III decarboxylase
MGKLTPKENFLRMVKGEIPESVPLGAMGFAPRGEPCIRRVGPTILAGAQPFLPPNPQPRVDLWGVKYVATKETGFGSIPEPGNFILKDVTKWHDVLKKPDFPDDYDWEAQAKKDIEQSKIDTNQSALEAMAMFSPFMQFIAFMGFNEGLCALAEEPEIVKELFNWMLEFYLPQIVNMLDHYKPDSVFFADDTATKFNPFISVEMYRDLLKPIYQKMAKPVMERGIPIHFHNCGRCEDFTDDIIEFGVKVWDPAQVQNNLTEIKRKYSPKFSFIGGFELKLPKGWPEVKIEEEDVRQQVRATIDKYAPGGGYSFTGGVLADPGNTVAQQINAWAGDEAYNYCDEYYNKH